MNLGKLTIIATLLLTLATLGCGGEGDEGAGPPKEIVPSLCDVDDLAAGGEACNECLDHAVDVCEGATDCVAGEEMELVFCAYYNQCLRLGGHPPFLMECVIEHCLEIVEANVGCMAGCEAYEACVQ